jgi:lipopolysaccharide export system permease protein
LRKEPEELTTWNIYKQIQFLTENQLNADIYKVELYKRLVKPLTLVAMILLAMLFIFGSNRDTSLGRKLFLGIALGLSFELTSRIGAAMSIGFSVSPLMSAILPSLSVMILAIVLLRQRSAS